MKQIVVVGGSIAALRAVETLRREGYDGELTMISAERRGPYARPPLSKQLLTGEMPIEAVAYRSEAFYQDLGITLRLDTSATGLDVWRRRVLLGSEEIPYDGLIIATGARARTIRDAEGLAGIHSIRSLDDALAIRDAFAVRPRVVGVGGGVIGCEVASSARALGLDVTIIEAANTLMTRAVSPRVGHTLAAVHAGAGVTVISGRGVSGFLGYDRVEGVRLDDGKFVPADLVVMGVGIVPNVEWLKGSGLRLDNGLACDRDMHAHGHQVYGAGDVASWPNLPTGRRVRSEQWTTATEQAVHAARQLVGLEESGVGLTSHLYFWSDQHGRRIQGIGDPQGCSTELLAGSLESNRFIVGYRRVGQLVGGLAINMPPHFVVLRRLVGANSSWTSLVEAFSALALESIPS
jgi:3-phenylpropionate/trans-cinnamate dioxygenase ferredoxin reductase subunit